MGTKINPYNNCCLGCQSTGTVAMYVAEAVAEAEEKAIKSVPGVEYFVAEIEHWKQRCEELELELLMLENSYDLENVDANGAKIKPKERGLF